jgi:hypothetical protein
LRCDRRNRTSPRLPNGCGFAREDDVRMILSIETRVGGSRPLGLHPACEDRPAKRSGSSGR